MLNSNTWNHLTVCKQISSGSFKDNVTYKLFVYESGFDIKWATWVDMP